MLVRTEHNSIDEAARKYPTLRSTLKQAAELGFNLIGHKAKFSRRGAVMQHQILVVDSDGRKWWTHQDLKGWISVIKDIKKRQEKENGNKVTQTDNA